MKVVNDICVTFIDGSFLFFPNTSWKCFVEDDGTLVTHRYDRGAYLFTKRFSSDEYVSIETNK